MDAHYGQLAAAAAENETIAAAELGAAAATPFELETSKDYSVVLPQGHEVKVLELDHLKERPRRATGTHTASTVDSFMSVVDRYDADAVTTIWVHPTSGAVVAVLNDHAQYSGEWGDHRVALQLLQTDEWKRWLARDGQLLEQEAFAEHLQDGLPEIARPDAATLLEIAQTMQGTTTAQWQSKVNLRDGAVQMGYQEDASAQAGREQNIPIPEEFVLVLAPFIGEDPIEINARLRWRIKGGNLRIGYKLAQPELVIRATLEQIAARLDETYSGRVFTGTPRQKS